MLALSQRYAALPPERRAAFRQRVAEQRIDPGALPVVPLADADNNEGGDAPLSFEQEHLWFLWKLQPDDPAYHMPGALDLHGALDAEALDEALRRVAQRHQGLRTRFVQRADGELRQTVAGTPLPVCRRHDLRGEQANATALDAAMRRAAAAPFDLEAGPPMRADLFCIGETHHVLLLTLHHIVTDGQSMNLLVRDIAQTYAQLCSKESNIAEESTTPGLQMRDCARWQREWLDEAALNTHLDYWRAQLGTRTPPSPLPYDAPRPHDAAEASAGARLRREIVPELAARLQAQAGAHGATLFMALLAAFGALLYRYSSRDDVRIGVPSSTRTGVETENIVGFFVNTLVVRQRPRGAMPFTALLGETRQTLLDAQAHRALPFARLVQALRGAGNDRHDETAPFHAMFSLQRSQRSALDALPGLDVHTREIDTGAAQFDLSFNLVESAQGIALNIVYASARFDARTVARLADHYLDVLAQIAQRPDMLLAELDLSAADAESAQPATAHKHAFTSVLEHIGRHLRERPDAEAVTGEHRSLSWRELHDWTQAVKHALAIEASKAPGTIAHDRCVGLCTGRTPALVAGALGILRSGAAYLPLDPHYPIERLQDTLADAGARCVVADAEGMAALGDWAREHGIAMIDADALALAPQAQSGELASVVPHPDQLAYMIYTSGSSGRPKGVGVTHANLARLFDSTTERFGFGAHDVWTLFHSPSFDFSVWELFGPLVHGARLVLVPYWTARAPDAMQRLLREQRVSVLSQTPSAFEALMRADLAAEAPFTDVRVVVFGGEKLEPATLAAWHRARRDARTPLPQLVNMYGITETTVHVTYRALNDADIHGSNGRIASPIGEALDDLQLHLLDADMNPVPPGATGELFVGGAGLARGYANRPGLTAERFVPDPFGTPGTRLYRSGDTARRLADGELAYLGRNDDQVKLRGFRIEPGEVRAALLRHADIASVEVVFDEHPQRGARLVAYLVPSPVDSPSKSLIQSVRAFAATQLPAHLRPAAFVVLDALPLTINGKLDRHALPAPEASSAFADETGDIEPLTPSQQALAALWRDVLGVLGVEALRASDDFFARGGHSLLAVRLAALIQTTFGVALPLRAFFDYPTLGALAAQIELARSEAPSNISALPPLVARSTNAEHVPLAFAQERLWFLWRFDPRDTAYTITCAVDLQGTLDRAALRSAFDALSLRHEALRTSFGERDGVAWQQIHDAPRYTWSEREASGDARIAACLREAAAQPFDLAHDPLLRITLMRADETRHVLHLAVHHIVADGESLELMLDELCALYRAAAEPGDTTHTLAQLPLQYGDYAHWQRHDAGEAALDAQIDYWRGLLGESATALELPRRVDRDQQASRALARVERTLDETRMHALQALADAQRTSLFTVLLAAFDVLLQRYSGQDGIRVGVPVSGRTQAHTAQMVGCFVNTLVMRADVDSARPFADLLAQVRQRVLDAHAHADVPFARLVEALQPARDEGASPLFQVMFNYQRTQGATRSLPGLSMSPLPVQGGTAQFDLKLDVLEIAGRARLHFDFADGMFDTAVIEGMADYFVMLIDWIGDHADVPLRSLALPVVTREAVPLDGYAFEPVAERVARQLMAQPERVALRGEHAAFNGAQLQQWANSIAASVRNADVKRDACVAVCVERSPALIAAMLGLWQAGAAYLPVDPAYPDERIAAMLDDARVTCVIADATTASRFETLNVVRADLAFGQSCEVSFAPVHPDQLAYVIYTSGSTGKPKGVGVTHGALDRLVASIARKPGLPAEASWLSESAPVFDISLLEYCLPLVAGIPLEIVSAQTARDGFALAKRLEESGANVFQATPSGWRMLIEAGWRKDFEAAQHPPLLGISGGEALHPDLAAALIARNVTLWNIYGPTETTIYSAGAQVHADEAITHGDPLPDTVLRVIDRQGAAVPDGGLGELCIGGENLARGYLGRPGLTAERFVPDPDGAPGARIYRTGDLCRLRADGRPEPFGRLDQQIKLRGFRIEPGEIEAALCACEGVAHAAVVLRGEGARQRLAAYVSGTAQPADLRAQLTRTLPAHMVPSAIVALATLPLTPSGKLDRRALPEPAWDDDNAQAIAPRNEREQTLLDIWQSVLGHAVHSVCMNFFEAGGDSILSLQLIARLRGAGWTLTPRQIFDQPTIEQQARIMTACADNAPLPAERHDALPLTPIQAAFFARRPHGESHWNQSVLLESADALDADRLRAALQALVQRHDALRLRFAQSDAGWQQRVAPQETADLLRVVQLDEHNWNEALAQAGATIQQSLDIVEGPLLRAACFEAGKQHRLLIAIHHLAVDGVSWRVLLDDLQALYAGDAVGGPALPWSAWVAAQASHSAQNAQNASADTAAHTQWQRTLDAARPAFATPPANNAAENAAKRSADRSLGASRRVSVSLDAQATARLLQQSAHAYRTRPDDLLLAALSNALNATRDDDDETAILIDLESHGRDLPPGPLDAFDLSRSVGWFTVQYPFALPRAQTPERTLIAVKEALRAVPAQGFGASALNHADAQLRFNYLGQFDGALGTNASRAQFAFSHDFAGAPLAPHDTLEHLLDITAMVSGGELALHWRFSPDLLDAAQVEALAARTVAGLRALIEHCVAAPAGASASDFPLAGIDQTTLDAMRLPLADIEDIYPATPLQQGLLYHSLLNEGAGLYVNQLRLTLDGALDARALRAAWQHVIAQHAVLRTHFELGQESGPLQVVHRAAQVPFGELDWRASGDDYETRLAAWRDADLRAGFDPARAPLMRVALIARPDGAHDLVWTSHHALLDGWSSGQLLGALSRVYRHYADAAAPEPTTTPAAPYRDYVRWLAHDAATRDHAAWWQAFAANAEDATLLAPSLGQPRPQDIHQEAHHEAGAHDWSVRIDGALHARLRRAAERAQVTLNTLMQGAWALLVARYGGRSRAAFGVTVSGRPAGLPGVERMLGLFINSVPMWVDTPAGANTRDWLRDLHALNETLRDHEHTPMTRIQQWTGRSGDALFDTLFVFENYPVDRALDAAPGGLTMRSLHSADRTHYPLTLAVLPRGDLDLQWAWQGERFARASVEALSADYVHVLEQFAAALLDAPQAEHARLGARLGDIALAAAPRETQPQRIDVFDAVTTRFSARALQHPARIALACRGDTLSYGALDAWSDAIAARLVQAGLRADQRVGVCVTRGVGLPAALLGIWKAGGAWVPLDPDYPRDRLADMLDDAQVQHLVADAACLARLGELFAARRVVTLERADADANARANTNAALPALASPEQLAYVIYTSGSTGKPKGVAISHRALSLHLADFQRVYGIAENDVVLQSSTINFDVALHELMPALLAGARVEMRGPDAWDLDTLNATLVNAGVTFARIPTALWQQWQHSAPAPQALRALRQITVGGEALAGDALARWRNGPLGAIRVDNLYGPTETAVAALWHRTGAADTAHSIVPIGVPFAARGVALLDVHGQSVPPGGIGELCISGASLARGYLARPGLSAERFVPDPLGAPGARLYRTGDLCRIGADGVVQFLGRIDQQIKLRGQRIEPGEIEAALRACAGVRQAVVGLHGEGERQQLVAWIVGAAATDVLAATLRARLPEAWVPGAFVTLERLPMLPNGKLDRRALPAPDLHASAAPVAPRDDLEQAIATVWQDVLAAPALSVHDNFHALGGHSLLAVQIAARLTRVLAQPVALAAVLAHGTVARLAQHLRDNAAEQAAAAQQQEAAADDRDVMKRLLAELD